MTLTRDDLADVAEELATALGEGVTLAPLPADAPGTATPAWRPRYNVAPTDAHPVVVAGPGGLALTRGQWGLPRSGGKGLVINARAETAAVQPAFRDAVARRRCVVVADGFFEWQRHDGERRPLWFHRADGGLLLMAGVFDDATGPLPRFVVLTTAPDPVVAPVHDRMPAVLSPEAARTWLSPRGRARALQPGTASVLVATPVSSRVNQVRNDDAACLLAPDGAPVGQMSLPLTGPVPF